MTHTRDRIDQAVETINRVEKQMIAEMTDFEYATWMSFSEDHRKQILYLAYKSTR